MLWVVVSLVIGMFVISFVIGSVSSLIDQSDRVVALRKVTHAYNLLTAYSVLPCE